MSYLKKNYPNFHVRLSSYKLASANFDKEWKKLATDPKFAQAQHDYIKSSYYDPAVSRINKSLGLNVNTRSKALQDVIWSTAVQHGVGGALTVFKNAGVKNGMSDREIIQRVYKERGANGGAKYFKSTPAAQRKNIVNRFKNEMNDALRMLG